MRAFYAAALAAALTAVPALGLAQSLPNLPTLPGTGSGSGSNGSGSNSGTKALGPASVGVQVTVNNGCSWSAPSGTQTFSSYNPSAASATTSDNLIGFNVICSTGTPYSFSISGISWSGSASSNPSIVETIYNANSSGSIGSPPTTPSSPTGNSVNQYYAIQGSMAAGQWGLSSGSYSGTFTVTLSYS